MRTRMLIIPVVLLALVAAARRTVFRPVSRNSTTNVVTVRAGEYFFDAPDHIPAGMTTIRLVTTGKEMHHVTMFRLAGEHTVAQLLEAFKTPGPIPAWATAVGGPNAPAPGGTIAATIEMTPGNYAFVCFIPGRDGAPHMMKGMAHALTVTGKPAGSAPNADIDLRLADYDFTTSVALSAGHHTIRVENTAAQDHEVEFVKLAPGKTAKDVVSWIEKMDGPPAGLPAGGASVMAPKAVNYIDIEFTAGRYALICFAPDMQDGQPHFMKEMMKEIDVK
ncbi:MAG: hypothetical protein ABIT38_01855 [Gemmatimonadaceae bacterium]